MKVIVIGAGVSGITCASLLAEVASEVEIWSKDDPSQTTSATAGAFWYPYGIGMTEDVLNWTRTSYDRFCQLAEVQSSGVRLETASLYFRQPSLIPAWISIPQDVLPIESELLPTGYLCGLRARLPVMEMPVYLEYLVGNLSHNVKIVRHTVTSMAELAGHCDLVVNCSGVGARELCRDSGVRPVYGDLIKVRKTGQERLIADMERPTYIIPRSHDCVLGATLRNEETSNGDSDEVQDVMARCHNFSPALAESEILSVTCCARPYRHSIRLETETHGELAWIHNYGHCGAGITLSWGCAAAVLQLAQQVFKN